MEPERWPSLVWRNRVLGGNALDPRASDLGNSILEGLLAAFLCANVRGHGVFGEVCAKVPGAIGPDSC